MNECRHFAMDLSAYYDGELESEEKAVLENHLNHCTQCRKALEKMEQISLALSRALEVYPEVSAKGNHAPWNGEERRTAKREQSTLTRQYS